MIELMKQYNHLISRYYKAIDFFQKNPEQIYKFIAQHKELINNLDSTRTQIITAGYAMTDNETLNGFRQIKYLEV